MTSINQTPGTSIITDTLSRFFMPVPESSHVDEQLQQEKQEEKDIRARLNEMKSPATPDPSCTSPENESRTRVEEAFNAGDEEKARADSSPPHQITTSPTSITRVSNTVDEEVRCTPSTHPTTHDRFRLAMVLENSGSTARDHLASERTFLAYVRTSLALASTGVALVQLFTIADLTSISYNLPSPTRHIQKFARPLGSTSILLGILVLLIGLTRYFTVQTALVRGMFPTARSSIVFITVVLLAVTIIVFVLLLVHGR